MMDTAYFCAMTQNHLQKHVFAFLNDHELCERIGTAARAAVIDKYDQTKIKRLIQEYLTVPEKGKNQSKPCLVQ